VPILRLGVSFPQARCSGVHWRFSPAGTGKRRLKPCASRTSGGEAYAFMQLEGEFDIASIDLPCGRLLFSCTCGFLTP